MNLKAELNIVIVIIAINMIIGFGLLVIKYMLWKIITFVNQDLVYYRTLALGVNGFFLIAFCYFGFWFTRSMFCLNYNNCGFWVNLKWDGDW